jgi:hypothetical protein
MEAKKPNPTLLVLFGAAALLLLVGQFIDWFRTSASAFGASFHAGFNAWSMGGGAGSFSGSRQWMSQIGEDGSTWQSVLMAFAGPILLVATALAVVGLVATVQTKGAAASKAGLWSGVGGAVACLFGFIMNYTSDGSSLDLYVGIFLVLAGTACAFTAGAMANSATVSQAPPASAPGTATRPRP